MILREEIDYIVGRDELLSDLSKDIKKEKNKLLTGDAGVGKKTILKALHDAFCADGRKSIFISQSNPMKQCLDDIAEQLFRNHDLEFYECESNQLNAKKSWKELKRPIQRMTIKDLTTIIIKSLQDAAKKQGRKYIIHLNDLQRTTPTQEAFFETLSHHATLVGATSKTKANLRKVWWMFREVKVPVLEDNHIKEIAERYINKKGLIVDDRKFLLTAIVKVSRGNPLACAHILDEYKGEKVITKAHIREFHAEAGVIEVDMTPVVFAAAALGIGIRFLALGLDNPALYILAGFAYAGFYFIRPFLYKAMRGK